MRLAVGIVAILFFGTYSLLAKETVPVEKTRSLAGLWQINVPESFGLSIFQSAHFGSMRPIYCRVEEANDIHCLSGGYSAQGSVTLHCNAVHVAWGTAMARMVIDALVGNRRPCCETNLLPKFCQQSGVRDRFHENGGYFGSRRVSPKPRAFVFPQFTPRISTS